MPPLEPPLCQSQEFCFEMSTGNFKNSFMDCQGLAVAVAPVGAILVTTGNHAPLRPWTEALIQGFLLKQKRITAISLTVS